MSAKGVRARRLNLFHLFANLPTLRNFKNPPGIRKTCWQGLVMRQMSLIFGKTVERLIWKIISGSKNNAISKIL